MHKLSTFRILIQLKYKLDTTQENHSKMETITKCTEYYYISYYLSAMVSLELP